MTADSSKTWILLRGLTREVGHWGDFTARLQAAFPNDHFYPLDLPGAGIYYQHSSPCNIPTITQQLRQVAKDKGLLHSKIYLLSLSLGGMIAWEWLQQYPNEINGVVLINSSLASLSPFYQRLRWQCYRDLVHIVAVTDCYQRELNILKLISNKPEQYEILANTWGEIQTLRPVSLQNTLYQLIAAARYSPGLLRPISPLLVLNSLGDRLVAPDCSVAISQHFSLPLVSHPWAGHDLCIDDPRWVIGQIHQWLSACGSVSLPF